MIRIPHCSLLLALALALTTASFPNLRAAESAPSPGPLTPVAEGVSRFPLGDFTVYALSEGDGAVGPEKVFFPEGADKAALTRAEDWNKTGMNAFLVDTGKEKWLFDTGNALARGGKIVSLLASAGVKPEEVDKIFLTHLHPDHVGGLLNADGSRAFPRAVVHLATEEAAYWRDERQDGASFQLARQGLAAYGDDLRLFTQDEHLGGDAGVASIPTFGHTPGHTAFRVESAGKTLILWGDIVHVRPQLHNPDIYLSYDVDHETAVSTRRAFFQKMAESGAAIAASHLPAPGVGRLVRLPEGSYAWEDLRE